MRCPCSSSIFVQRLLQLCRRRASSAANSPGIVAAFHAWCSYGRARRLAATEDADDPFLQWCVWCENRWVWRMRCGGKLEQMENTGISWSSVIRSITALRGGLCFASPRPSQRTVAAHGAALSPAPAAAEDAPEVPRRRLGS